MGCLDQRNTLSLVSGSIWCSMWMSFQQYFLLFTIDIILGRYFTTYDLYEIIFMPQLKAACRIDGHMGVSKPLKANC